MGLEETPPGPSGHSARGTEVPGTQSNRPKKFSNASSDAHSERRASKASQKRKTTQDADEMEPGAKKKRKTPGPSKSGEKRLKKERKAPSHDFLKILDRAQTQRMFVIQRDRTGTLHDPEETIKIAGSTGNLYTVVINKLPTCDCPHAKKGNHCKHIVYVMAKTLKARYHFQYQTALLSTELQELFDHAPPLPTEAATPEDTSGIRKPIEDDCPICCVEFDAENDDIVYCKAACGNNIHKECFKQWAAQKRSSRDKVTCPFCRTQWEEDGPALAGINAGGAIGLDGYVNIADQLGISGHRDTSTYHPFWVRRERRRGGLQDEDPDPRWFNGYQGGGGS